MKSLGFSYVMRGAGFEVQGYRFGVLSLANIWWKTANHTKTFGGKRQIDEKNLVGSLKSYIFA
jgi:hypothetical protein